MMPFFNTEEFYGTPQRLKLISNRLGYGPCPEETDIVEQHLTLCSDGRVWFSFYEFGYQGNYRCVNQERLQIDKGQAKFILNALAEYFAGGYVQEFVTDIGDWNMELHNTDGRRFFYTGPLTDTGDGFLKKQSSMIRQVLNKPDAFIFDRDYISSELEKSDHEEL